MKLMTDYRQCDVCGLMCHGGDIKPGGTTCLMCHHYKYYGPNCYGPNCYGYNV